jgi:hypothetical protein
MDPETLLLIADKNLVDVEAIINKVGGIANLLALMPHIINILRTWQAAQAAQGSKA